MAEARLLPATREHARELAPRMRAADAAEVLASGGYTPIEALVGALDLSERAWTLELGGEVAALFGVVPLRGTVLGPVQAGVIWALTGTTVERHRKSFARVSRDVLPALLEEYPALVNYVDDRYAAALRWAAWLGFDVGPPEPFGLHGLPFRRIVIRRPHV